LSVKKEKGGRHWWRGKLLLERGGDFAKRQPRKASAWGQKYGKGWANSFEPHRVLGAKKGEVTRLQGRGGSKK